MMSYIVIERHLRKMTVYQGNKEYFFYLSQEEKKHIKYF